MDSPRLMAIPKHFLETIVLRKLPSQDGNCDNTGNMISVQMREKPDDNSSQNNGVAGGIHNKPVSSSMQFTEKYHDKNYWRYGKFA